MTQRKTPTSCGGRGTDRFAGDRCPFNFPAPAAQRLMLPRLIALHLGGETIAAIALVAGGAA